MIEQEGSITISATMRGNSLRERVETIRCAVYNPRLIPLLRTDIERGLEVEDIKKRSEQVEELIRRWSGEECKLLASKDHEIDRLVLLYSSEEYNGISTPEPLKQLAHLFDNTISQNSKRLEKIIREIGEILNIGRARKAVYDLLERIGIHVYRNYAQKVTPDLEKAAKNIEGIVDTLEEILSKDGEREMPLDSKGYYALSQAYKQACIVTANEIIARRKEKSELSVAIRSEEYRSNPDYAKEVDRKMSRVGNALRDLADRLKSYHEDYLMISWNISEVKRDVEEDNDIIRGIHKIIRQMNKNPRQFISDSDEGIYYILKYALLLNL